MLDWNERLCADACRSLQSEISSESVWICIFNEWMPVIDQALER